MKAAVSLIITVYNREPFLAETIESVLSQTYRDFELLIWDDGSVAIAEHYALSGGGVCLETARIGC
jgi:glycosyltransferase involved in cell wall biosynthesis